MGEHSVSKQDLPAERLGAYEGRMAHLGDVNVAFESCPANFPEDPEAVFRGLPDDACQCEHWGYCFAGSFRIDFTDGTHTVVRAGEAYVIPPGHRFQALEALEIVEFSPKAEHDRTLAQIARNLEAMGVGA